MSRVTLLRLRQPPPDARVAGRRQRIRSRKRNHLHGAHRQRRTGTETSLIDNRKRALVYHIGSRNNDGPRLREVNEPTALPSMHTSVAEINTGSSASGIARASSGLAQTNSVHQSKSARAQRPHNRQVCHISREELIRAVSCKLRVLARSDAISDRSEIEHRCGHLQSSRPHIRPHVRCSKHFAREAIQRLYGALGRVLVRALGDSPIMAQDPEVAAQSVHSATAKLTAVVGADHLRSAVLLEVLAHSGNRIRLAEDRVHAGHACLLVAGDQSIADLLAAVKRIGRNWVRPKEIKV